MVTSSVAASQPRRSDIVLRVRRQTTLDGLILYSKGRDSSDFISLAVKNNAVEFVFGTDAG